MIESKQTMKVPVPDQTAPIGTYWSVTFMFAHAFFLWKVWIWYLKRFQYLQLSLKVVELLQGMCLKTEWKGIG